MNAISSGNTAAVMGSNPAGAVKREVESRILLSQRTRGAVAERERWKTRSGSRRRRGGAVWRSRTPPHAIGGVVRHFETAKRGCLLLAAARAKQCFDKTHISPTYKPHKHTKVFLTRPVIFYPITSRTQLHREPRTQQVQQLCRTRCMSRALARRPARRRSATSSASGKSPSPRRLKSAIRYHTSACTDHVPAARSNPSPSPPSPATPTPPNPRR